MAGSASNWYKATPGAPGASVKGRVYLPSAMLAAWSGEKTPEGLAEYKAELASRPGVVANIAQQNKKLAVPPKGAAKTTQQIAEEARAARAASGEGLAPNLPDWEEDPRAAKLAAYQAELKENGVGMMREARNPGDMLMREAFREANGHLSEFGHVSAGVLPSGYKELDRYQGDDYETTNKFLWGRPRSADGVMKVIADGASAILNNLLQSSKAPFNFTAYRRVREGHPLFEWAKSSFVGDSYVNKGFDSTSISPYITPFGKDLVVKMRIPRGAKGMYINGVFPNSNPLEQEWLVPANSSWVVSGKTTSPDGKIELTVDLVEQRTFDGKSIWP